MVYKGLRLGRPVMKEPPQALRTAVLLTLTIAASISAAACRSTAPAEVRVVRLPAGALQPEVAVDGDGVLHAVYLSGDPAAADVFYVRSSDEGRTFTPPLRVNSEAASAVATGTVRGAQIALGRNGLVHVAWNGSVAARRASAAPSGGNTGGAPMLYSRLGPGAAGFEPQRNLITDTADLDGGGTIAADDSGRVYVAWHGRAANDSPGEDHRRVWLALSNDDGRTFGAERAIGDAANGVCGCCALRMAASGDSVRLLYRTATERVHRDIHALISRDAARSFSESTLDRWEIGACPLTSMAIAGDGAPTYAWEHDGQIMVAPHGKTPRPAPGAGERRKHPRLAVDADGRVLLAWTEGTSWGHGGRAVWQVFDAKGEAMPVHGSEPALPAWTFAAVASLPSGFVLIH